MDKGPTNVSNAARKVTGQRTVVSTPRLSKARRVKQSVIGHIAGPAIATAEPVPLPSDAEIPVAIQLI